MSFFLDPFVQFAEIETAIELQKTACTETEPNVTSTRPPALQRTPSLDNPVLRVDLLRASPKSVTLSSVDEVGDDEEWTNEMEVSHAYTCTQHTETQQITTSKSMEQFIDILQSM